MAAVAVGANGLIIETHYAPELALSDGVQALLPSEFLKMLDQVRLIHDVMLKNQ